MATKELMGWSTSQKRWHKKYKGSHYSVSPRQLNTKPTQEASREAANAWWEAKQQEIDAKPDDAPKYAYQVAQIAWADANNPELAATLRSNLEALKTGRLPDGTPCPGLGVENTPEAWYVWHERLSRLKVVGVEAQVGHNVQVYLDLKRSQTSTGKLSLKRYDCLRLHLQRFSDWFGPTRAVAEINEKTVIQYHTNLAKDGVSGVTSNDRFEAWGQWIDWAWQMRLVEKPRNLYSREFRFKKAAPKKIIFSNPEIKTMLGKATSRLQLYLLLSLNCGYTQKDIATLRQDHLSNGRICRKRSKTSDIESVPEVSYKLWPQTLTLLQQHKSQGQGLLLHNDDGGALLTEKIRPDGKVVRYDNIRSAYNRLWAKLDVKKPKPYKALRKTCATLLDGHKEYGRYEGYFLGQSPRNIAQKHYAIPSQDLFDEIVAWLGTQLGIVEEPALV